MPLSAPDRAPTTPQSFPAATQASSPIFQVGSSPAKKSGMGSRFTSAAESVSDPQADSAADQRDQQSLEEKLLQDGICRRAQRFAHADLASALPHGDHHHVHHTQTAEEQRHHSDRAEEILHAVGHLAEGLGFLHRVPDRTGFFIRGIEVVHACQARSHLVLAGFMLFNGLRRDQQLVESVAVPGGLSGKSRRMAEKGMKTLFTSQPS